MGTRTTLRQLLGVSVLLLLAASSVSAAAAGDEATTSRPGDPTVESADHVIQYVNVESACLGEGFSEEFGDVAKLDVVNVFAFYCFNDQSLNFSLDTTDSWVDSDLRLLDVDIDLDRDPTTGCDGFEYTALGAHNPTDGLNGILLYDAGASCDLDGMDFVAEAVVTRESDTNLQISFSAAGLFTPPGDLNWIAWLCDNDDVCFGAGTDAAGTPSAPFRLAVSPQDGDDDGVFNQLDNCPSHTNPSQTDIDGDAIGDACDVNDERPNQIFVTNVIRSGPAEYDFDLGHPDYEILVGDWNGNGRDGFALRDGRTIREFDERGLLIRTVTYGSTSDTLYRVGDWDGDGTDTLAVQRGNIFHITNSPTATGQFREFSYGRPGDEVFIGDWDGDGIDTLTVRRGNVFFVRNSTTSGIADVVFGYGIPTDEVLIGDWDNDGTDTFAVRRGNIIFIRNDFQTGVAEVTIGYGIASDTLLVGDWNGDNIDTFAVQRID